jgi:TFIIF-interacting CTD phosphatase-like protein
MNNKKVYNVILDLDQTLIFAEPTEEYDFEKNKEKSSNFKVHDMDGYYMVFERPGLQEFLDFIFKNFNVSIWTAATKDYALFVIDKIILQKKNRVIDYIFFSYHCNISSKNTKKTKNLKILWELFGLTAYNKDNTVILDDYDEVQNTQPENCIAVKPFIFSENKSEKDSFLVKKIIPVLKKILKDKTPLQKIVKSANKNLQE